MYTVLCHRFLLKCILGFSMYVSSGKYYYSIRLWNRHTLSLGWSREGMTDADGDKIDADLECENVAVKLGFQQQVDFVGETPRG